MVRHAAWIADWPDGDNFMQLLYGPNIHESNNACYQSAGFDRRYKKSLTLPDGPERDRLYHEMTRLMEVDTVWLLADSRIRNSLQQPNVVGFTKHPVLHAEWLYLDLEPKPAP
jgi:ABC-type oligopeptide transport system substrate-binding subunit